MQRQFTSKTTVLFRSILCLLTVLISAGLQAANNQSVKASDLGTAHAAINDMNYTSAIDILNRYIKANPDDMEAQRLLAKTYSWDNQFQAAAELYGRLLKTKPNDPEYLFGEANALVWQNKNAEAIPLLEKARSLQPDNADILRTLILTLNISNKPGDKQRVHELSKLAHKQFPNMNWDLITE
jgi:cytochrome c-type biogenesis protein CcmH/NrfG